VTTLANLHSGEDAVVGKIHADGELKQRFFSLGLRKHAEIKVKAISLNKSTMEIEIGTSLLALRLEEAENIEVIKL